MNVDQHLVASVNAYEMLIRNQNNVFPGPDFFENLATSIGNDKWIQITQQAITRALATHPTTRLFINIEPCQMKFPQIWQFLTQVHQDYNNQVAIEITERRATIHDPDYLDKEILRLKKIGFDLTIDDVCAGSNSYAFVVRQLGIISRIKLSLLLFRNEDLETTLKFVDTWKLFAHKHQLEFVIEGVADRQIAEYFAGDPAVLQQGFFWGKGSENLK